MWGAATQVTRAQAATGANPPFQVWRTELPPAIMPLISLATAVCSAFVSPGGQFSCAVAESVRIPTISFSGRMLCSFKASRIDSHIDRAAVPATSLGIVMVFLPLCSIVWVWSRHCGTWADDRQFLPVRTDAKQFLTPKFRPQENGPTLIDAHAESRCLI